jgi:hypothetical protein
LAHVNVGVWALNGEKANRLEMIRIRMVLKKNNFPEQYLLPEKNKINVTGRVL